MTPGFMGSPREHSTLRLHREKGSSIGSSVSLGTFGRDTMKQYKLNMTEEIVQEERKLEEKRKLKGRVVKGTSDLLMEKHIKAPQVADHLDFSSEDEERKKQELR